MTTDDIRTIDYSRFVALIRERNRPSGGIRSVAEVAARAFLTPASRVLEMGCTTGFTSANLAALTGAEVVGIDINSDSLKEAERYCRVKGVGDRVEFRQADAQDLPFQNEDFDLVWCSNVASFIADKNTAIKECLRVLRLNGTLACIPIYYRSSPPQELVERVSAAIGTVLKVMSLDGWIAFFQECAKAADCGLTLYHSRNISYVEREGAIEAWIDQILRKPHLERLGRETRIAIRQRCVEFMYLFNENLRYCGSSILLYQKDSQPEESELFLTEPW